MNVRAPSTPTSVFGPDDDNVIPGEVIISLEAGAVADVGVSAASIATAAEAAPEVSGIGSAAVDSVLGDLGVQSVASVHSPGPPQVFAGIAMAADVGLDATLRVRYEAAEAPEAVAEQLGGIAEVAWAEPNRWREAAVIPDDPQFASQWGLTRIGCPEAWDQTQGDPSVVVAVVDTGVDLSHPELADLLLPGQDLVNVPPGAPPPPSCVFEGDLTGSDPTPQDEVGHGTHVAGTICCASNNAVGVAGVTWGARLLPVRVLVRVREIATGKIIGSGSSADIAAGIRWAADHGAHVINLSLGGYEDATVEREAIAYAVGRGVVVVAAMGNHNTDKPHFPGAYPGVIGVAATDSEDKRASFSNFGENVDISGPGVDIQSTHWGEPYASLNGTSMATPHVAGVAALMLSCNSGLSAEQVGDILRDTAEPLRDDGGEPVPNEKYGSGLVQAAAAVSAAAQSPAAAG
jgi:subtilisin family serine protease